MVLFSILTCPKFGFWQSQFPETEFRRMLYKGNALPTTAEAVYLRRPHAIGAHGPRLPSARTRTPELVPMGCPSACLSGVNPLNADITRRIHSH